MGTTGKEKGNQFPLMEDGKSIRSLSVSSIDGSFVAGNDSISSDDGSLHEDSIKSKEFAREAMTYINEQWSMDELSSTAIDQAKIIDTDTAVRMRLEELDTIHQARKATVEAVKAEYKDILDMMLLKAQSVKLPLDSVNSLVASLQKEMGRVTNRTVELSWRSRNLMISIGLLQRTLAFAMAVDRIAEAVARRRLDQCLASDISMCCEFVINLGTGRRSSLQTNANPFCQGGIVGQLKSRLEQLMNQVVDLVLDLFSKQLSNCTKQRNASLQKQLKLAASVADAISDGRGQRALVTWYCQHELEDYFLAFRHAEMGHLMMVPKRYAWLRRLLVQFDVQHVDIFPKTWHMDRQLCEAFCKGTKRDLQVILADPSACALAPLHDAVQETARLEAFFRRRFPLENDPFKQSLNFDSAQFEDNPDNDPINDGSKNNALNVKSNLTLMEVFENSAALFQFVEMHDAQIALEMKKLQSDCSQHEFALLKCASLTTNGSSCVSDGATLLFLLYRQVLSDVCSLSRRRPMLDMAMVFVKHLIAFARLLTMDRSALESHSSFGKFLSDGKRESRRASVDSPSSTSATATTATAAISKRDDLLEGMMGVLVNTASFCQRTVGQMAARICELIDDSLVEAVVSFDSVEAEFGSLLACSIAMMARHFELIIHGRVFDADIKWTIQNAVEEGVVGDQSAHVTTLISLLDQIQLIIDEYVYGSMERRNIWTKVAVYVASGFQRSLLAKLRSPVEPSIAQHMLMDLEIVRRRLSHSTFHSPSIGQDDDDLSNLPTDESTKQRRSAQAMERKQMAILQRIVDGETTEVEVFLKLMLSPCTPPSFFVHHFVSVHDGLQDHSVSKLKRFTCTSEGLVEALKFKGVEDASVYLEAFSMVTASSTVSLNASAVIPNGKKKTSRFFRLDSHIKRLLGN